MAAGGARSKEVGDEEGSGVRWIRSYVLQEDDGTLGTYCIYEAESRRRSARTPRRPASAQRRSTWSWTP
jgi:hypothetical protein